MRSPFTTVALFALMLSAGCTTATRTSETNVNTPVSGSENVPAKTVEAQEDTSGTPSDTIRIFFEAVKRKDVEVVKKYLSAISLQRLNDSAKAQNKSIAEIMAEDDEDLSQRTAPKTRNEKIDGDSASVEVYDDNGKKWEPVPLVREDGIWKIAFDKIKN